MGLGNASFGQDVSHPIKREGLPVTVDTTESASVKGTAYSDLLASAKDGFTQNLLKPVSTLQPNLYTKDFGFFCRKELQFEKTTKIPFRLRLGSLEQCNRLEQKD